MIKILKGKTVYTFNAGSVGTPANESPTVKIGIGDRLELNDMIDRGLDVHEAEGKVYWIN